MNQFDVRNKLRQQQMQGLGFSAAPLEDPNPGKWELDTTVFIDRQYNNMLGRTLKDGVWVDDKNKVRLMNEKGASVFKSAIESVFNIHSQLSSLKSEEVVDIATYTAEKFVNSMVSSIIDGNVWEIDTNNMDMIGQNVYNICFIALQIAKDGGMKKHRERVKNPYAVIQQQPQEVI